MTSTTPGEALSYGYDLLGGLRKDLKTLQGFRTVVQELLQNAEDARDLVGNAATEFWLDFRDDGLWIGNDGHFTDGNFDAIARIGAGSKRYDEGTIGSFGVGFVSVYQITDQPEIYSRGERRILSPLDGKAYRTTGINHPWPSTFRLPWADSWSEVRRRLEAQPVKREDIPTFIEDARSAFAECAVFLRHLRTLNLLIEGRPTFSLKIKRPETKTIQLVGSDGLVSTFRRLDVELPSNLLAEAQARGRKTDLTLAYPVTPVPDFTGRLYAYLPTREESYLPVHINADFYPNTDRKSLLWDEADKRRWNEQLLQVAAESMPDVLLDLQEIEGTEAVYDFATKVSAGDDRLQHTHQLKNFTRAAWKACYDAFRKLNLFEGRDGRYVAHRAFLVIRYPHDDLLAQLLTSQLEWVLPPEQHESYSALFERLDVDTLDIANFFGALKHLFSEFPTWLQLQEQPALEVLIVFFDYLELLKREEGHKLEKHLGCLDDLFIALNVERRPRRLSDLRMCPPAHLNTVKPWLADGERVADEWLKVAPAIVRQRVPKYLPEDFCAALAQETPEAIDAHIQEGWELRGAYDFLETGIHLSSQQLRLLPIYRTQAGALRDGTQLLFSEGFTDPFGVREVLSADTLQGFPGLLERLDLTPLNAQTYYSELLPEFFTRHSEQRRAIIEHLAQSFQSLNLSAWKQVECVECIDGQWRVPSACYFSNRLLESLFGQEYPAFKEEVYPGTGIRGLFTHLGVRTEAAEDDIVAQLGFRQSEALTPQAIELRRSVLGYALTQGTPTLAQKLSEVAWLPNEQRTAWRTPRQLYPPSTENLIGRPANVEFCGVPVPNKEMKPDNRKALQFAKPQASQVIEYIRVRNRKDSGPGSAILRWLEQRSKSLSADEIEQLKSLRLFPYQHPSGKPHFDYPKNFFTEDPGLGRWRHTLGKSYGALASRLDVLDKPRWETYMEVLLRIARTHVEGGVPSPEDFKVAESCFHRLSQAFSSLPDQEKDLLISRLAGQRIIPTTRENRRGSLSYAKNSIYRDMPSEWFKRFNFPLEHPNYVRKGHDNPEFLEALGVALLSKSYSVHYIPRNGEKFQPLSGADERLAAFTPALLRFLFKEFGQKRLYEFQQLLPQLRFALSSEIKAYVEVRTASHRMTSQCQLEAGFDPKTQRLMVVSVKPKLGAAALAEAFGLRESSQRTTLSSIWKSSSLQEAKEELDFGHYPNLPEEFQPTHIPAARVVDGAEDTEAWEDTEEKTASLPAEPPATPIARDGASNTREPAAWQPESAHTRRFLDPAPAVAREVGEPSAPVRRTENERREKVQRSESTRPISPGHKAGPSPFAGPPPSEKRDGHRPAAQRSERTSGSLEAPEGRSRRGGQKQFKNYVYTYKESDREVAEEAHSQKVDRRGMQYAMEYERRHNRTPEDCSADTGAGYDIFSTDMDGQVRHIELKTISGAWGNRGVTLSRNQLAAARKYGERYWLYVIEDLDGQPQLHTIQHPEGQVTYYVFNGSWQGNASHSEELVM